MKGGGYPRVVTAYAQPAAGPGWANSPVYVIMEGEDRKLYQECIQPDEQTKEMRILYRLSSEITFQMQAEADKIMAERAAREKRNARRRKK